MTEIVLVLLILGLVGFILWDHNKRSQYEDLHKQEIIKLQTLLTQERVQLSKTLEKNTVNSEKTFAAYLKHIQTLEKGFFPVRQVASQVPKDLENEIEKKEDEDQDMNPETIDKIVALGRNVKIIRDESFNDLPTTIL